MYTPEELEKLCADAEEICGKALLMKAQIDNIRSNIGMIELYEKSLPADKQPGDACIIGDLYVAVYGMLARLITNIERCEKSCSNVLRDIGYSSERENPNDTGDNTPEKKTSGLSDTKHISTLYLVDHENTAHHWTDIEYEPGSIICVFTPNPGSKPLSEDVCAMMDKGCDVRLIKTDNGSGNALDFQLAVWLGINIEAGNAEKYAIVSRDKGFDAAVSLARRYKNTDAVRIDHPLPDVTSIDWLSDAVRTAKKSSKRSKACIKIAAEYARLNACSYEQALEMFLELLLKVGYDIGERDNIIKNLKKAGTLKSGLGF